MVSLDDARATVGDVGSAGDVAALLRDHLERVMKLHIESQNDVSKALLASINTLREENDSLRAQRSQLASEVETMRREVRELIDATVDRTVELEEAQAKREKTEAMTRIVGQLVAKRTGANVSPEALAKVVQLVTEGEKKKETPDAS